MHYSQLPLKAFRKISARQRSYIDEFTFTKVAGGIEATYAGEYMGTWNGKVWEVVS